MTEFEAELREDQVAADPIDQFRIWFADAEQAVPKLPNAMTLATVDLEGKPSARIVLMKAFDKSGFTFFTNYDSRKGSELEENANAALVFYWPELERQVRIEGSVTKVSQQESEEYFWTRPIESQIGAWASRQSSVLSGRRELEERFNQLAAEIGDGVVPLPATWGGYLLKHNSIEFWLGRHARLHDRIRYRRLIDDTARQD